MYGPHHPHSQVHKENKAQQEKIIQEQDRVQCYFFSSQKELHDRETWKNYCLANSFQLSPPKKAMPNQKKKKKFLWHPEAKDIECSKAEVSFLN